MVGLEAGVGSARDALVVCFREHPFDVPVLEGFARQPDFPGELEFAIGFHAVGSNAEVGVGSARHGYATSAEEVFVPHDGVRRNRKVEI